ncbi:hypothetical protein GQ54DRAFT_298099 [Martensiomyces pterosporus]|nr:hypothetical protein GQ54DRAFT_298099 [Martensiomyces pterosporus]
MAIASGCAAIVALVAALILSFISIHRRRQTKTPHGDEEMPGARSESETQPLLNDSSIRTRYVSDHNEFARSFIDRNSDLSYASPQGPSLIAAAVGGSPYSPAENVVTIMPTDSSDSDDSSSVSALSTSSSFEGRQQQGSDSDAVGATGNASEATTENTEPVCEQPAAATPDENSCARSAASSTAASTPAVASPADPCPATPACMGSTGEVASELALVVIPKNTIGTGLAFAPSVPAPVHTAFEFSQSPESEEGANTTDDDDDDDNNKQARNLQNTKAAAPHASEKNNGLSKHARYDLSAAQKPYSTALKASAKKLISGRPRSSTLNAQAKAFVPTRQLRIIGSAVNKTPNPPRPSVSNGSSCETASAICGLSDSQLQALGRTVSDHGSERLLHDTPIANRSTRSSFSESTAGESKSSSGGGMARKQVGVAQQGGSSSNSSGAVVHRRCRFWPSCNNKNCKYVHPSRTCRMYPSCSFGVNCIYIHPTDAQKISIVLSRGSSRRSKRSQNDIIRLNNLQHYAQEP